MSKYIIEIVNFRYPRSINIPHTSTEWTKLIWSSEFHFLAVRVKSVDNNRVLYGLSVLPERTSKSMDIDILSIVILLPDTKLVTWIRLRLLLLPRRKPPRDCNLYAITYSPLDCSTYLVNLYNWTLIPWRLQGLEKLETLPRNGDNDLWLKRNILLLHFFNRFHSRNVIL